MYESNKYVYIDSMYKNIYVYTLYTMGTGSGFIICLPIYFVSDSLSAQAVKLQPKFFVKCVHQMLKVILEFDASKYFIIKKYFNSVKHLFLNMREYLYIFVWMCMHVYKLHKHPMQCVCVAV